jgi:multidrug resistance efflux pump
MVKLIAATCLTCVLAGTIAIIDATSNAPLRLSTDDNHNPGLSAEIYATGIVEGATEDIHLRPEHAGRVSDVFVKAGDWVEAGDVLLRLDQDRQKQEVALAAANLALAEAELERLENGARPEEREEARALLRADVARHDQAARNLQRMEQLHGERAVTQQDVDDHRAVLDTTRAAAQASQARLDRIEAPARADEVRAAKARVAAAQAEKELANIGLAKTELRAPHNACVLDVDAEPGELIGLDSPEPTVVLVDTSTTRVRAFVEELDAPGITVGMKARITADGLPGKSYSATVVSVSPCMAPKSIESNKPHELYDTKTRQVLLDVEPTKDLIVGLRVDVLFEHVGP